MVVDAGTLPSPAQALCSRPYPVLLNDYRNTAESGAFIQHFLERRIGEVLEAHPSLGDMLVQPGVTEDITQAAVAALVDKSKSWLTPGLFQYVVQVLRQPDMQEQVRRWHVLRC